MPQPIYTDANGTWWTRHDGAKVRSTVTKETDPAYALIANPDVYSTPDDSIYRDTCYICVDPEFAMMGLPLCYPCLACGGHVAADAVTCDDCGANQYALYKEQQDT